jgi:hypothetical protein
MPGSDAMANALLSEKYEKRAKLRAKSEEEYQQLVDKETRQAELLENRNKKGTFNQQANDNSQQTIVNNMATTVRPEAGAKQDSMNKQKRHIKSDIRLKENIQLIEEGKDGNPNIYSFNYKEDKNTKWKGVMAQELIDTELSDAVITDAKGFYMVDYTRLGFPMVEIKE